MKNHTLLANDPRSKLQPTIIDDMTNESTPDLSEKERETLSELLEAIEGLRTYGEEHCDSETYFGAAVFSDTENEQITPTVSLDDPTPFHGSNDLQHRWALDRTCSNTDGKRLLVIGMNPSSASTLDETTHGGAPHRRQDFQSLRRALLRSLAAKSLSDCQRQ